MKTVFDYAKWFLINNIDKNKKDKFRDQMKLHKLLFFAQLISLSKYNKLLFKDNFSAYENGMVLTNIREKYNTNISDIYNRNDVEFTEDEIDVLNLTNEIFGLETAETLSEISHQFDYWNEYYKNSQMINGHYDKSKSVVPNEELQRDLDLIDDVLFAHEYKKTEEYKKMEEYDY